MDKLRIRREDSHKGDYGKLLIIAGSPGMAGAAVLCARGAYRSGAGLVKVSLPEMLFPVLQISVPEAICLKREERPEDLQFYDGIIFGPGIGLDSLELKLLEWILKEYDKKILLDADGLNLIAAGDRIRWLHQTRARLILTPHPGEAKKLLGMGPGDRILPEERKDAARRLHEETGAVIVLKGHQTVIYDGHRFQVNDTGNPGMATAGSGDVLAGIIGSLWVQGYEAGEAARLGTRIHGLAGDLAADRFGQDGLMAGDLCRYTAYGMKKIMEEQR